MTTSGKNFPRSVGSVFIFPNFLSLPDSDDENDDASDDSDENDDEGVSNVEADKKLV